MFIAIFLTVFFLVRNGIFTSLLVQLTFHEYVKEQSNRREVSELAADICCPEERVLLKIISFFIWEADEINGHMPKYFFRVQCVTDRLTNFSKVDLRQGCLWRETANIDKLGPLDLVKAANEASETIWLNDEGYRWVFEIAEVTIGRSAFDHAPDSTELFIVLIPAIWPEARHG